MSLHFIAPIAFLATTLSAAVGADGGTDYWVRVMPGLWFEHLGGHVAYGTNSSNPSEIDLDELGVAGRHDTLAIEASAQIPFLFGLHAGYSDISTHGTRTLTRDISFAGLTYSASDTVRSEVELRDLYGEFCVRPINTSLAGFSIGVAVHGLYARAELKDLTFAQDETFSKTIPIPVGALRAHITPLPGLTVEGRVHFIHFAHNGDSGRFGDYVAQVEWLPVKWLGITAGYRLMDIDVKITSSSSSGNDSEAKLRLGGPFAGVIAKF